MLVQLHKRLRCSSCMVCNNSSRSDAIYVSPARALLLLDETTSRSCLALMEAPSFRYLASV